MLILWLQACGGAVDIDPTTRPSGTEPTVPVTDTDSTEPVGGVETDPVDDNADTLFVTDRVHQLTLDIPAESLTALSQDPRSYAAATWTHDGETLDIGVRLKGNTSYTWFDEKPALIVDFDFAVEDQRYRGLPSVYLQNMLWDPSMVHEHLAYWFYRQVGVPASRSAYTLLTINDTDYGLYLLLEKQNSLFRKQWWEDRSGSVYEAGSFNHPCDLNDGSNSDPCACYEIDRVGDGDDFTDLQDLCLAARTPDADWVDQVSEHVDWPVFLQAQAAEMVVSHYDNYGWNINNYRLYHEPTLGRFYWTPWSNDLAFGWYPWVGGPHCGTYGRTPDEYQGGFLIKRCWSDPACADSLIDVVGQQVDAFESLDMGAELDQILAVIQEDVLADPRNYYTAEERLGEQECVRGFIAERADDLRAWAAGR